MRRIKDFFYNKNDIIIVLIILAVAAFIIYTRIGVIMDYPEKQAETATTAVEITTESTTVSETETTKSSTKPSTSANAPSSKNSSKMVSITITDSDTSITVAQKLEKAGLVDSATEFESYISNMDKSDLLQSGTFKIAKGSSYKKILNTITN